MEDVYVVINLECAPEACVYGIFATIDSVKTYFGFYFDLEEDSIELNSMLVMDFVEFNEWLFRKDDRFFIYKEELL